MVARLASGDTLPVFRVKYWTFPDSSPAALQLEYEPPFDVTDTAAVRKLATSVWPEFAPHVERLELTMAILTATNMRRASAIQLRAAAWHSWGFVARRDSAHAWRFDGDSEVLPPANPRAPLRIFFPNGAPVEINEKRLKERFGIP